MARLDTLGWELNTLTVNLEWGTVNTNSQTIDPDAAHSGGYGMRNTQPGASSNTAKFFVAANTQGVYRAQIWVRIWAAPTSTSLLLSFVDSAGSLRAQIKVTSGLLLQLLGASVQVGSNSSAVSLGQWFCIELSVDNTTLASSIIEGRLNGTVFATGTQSMANAFCRTAAGVIASDSTLIIDFDDVIVNDNTGGSETGYPGGQSVFYLRPYSPGTVNTFATQTGGTSGSANNYTRVSEITPDDVTSFNGSSTLNQEDLFRITPLQTGGKIYAVQLNARFRNSVADATGAITFEIKKISTGTVSSSSAIIPNSATWSTNAVANPHIPVITLYNDPDGNPLTRDTLNNDIMIGYKLTTGPGTAGRRIDVSNLWLAVSTETIPKISSNNHEFFKGGDGMSFGERIR